MLALHLCFPQAQELAQLAPVVAAGVAAVLSLPTVGPLGQLVSERGPVMMQSVAVVVACGPQKSETVVAE